jgi:hypothetical protein
MHDILVVEICELWMKYLWSNAPGSVYGDGSSAGATDTNRVFGMSMDL